MIQYIGLALAIVCSAGCRVFTVDIHGEAMDPTLKNGERAIATRNVDRLDRGEIVAFRYPRDESKSFVKRIVALPGEQIEMKDGRVLINGKRIEESYVDAANRSTETWAQRAVPAGEYFVMGDNRRNSSDSRHWGTVPRDLVWAKVVRQ